MLSRRDQKVIWHPYTQHALAKDPLPVVAAEGAYLTLENGTRILDAISSWWVNLHGHSHPVISKAIAEQAAKMEHVIFAGFTHEPAVRLAELLLEGANRTQRAPFSRVFYSDNGSTAVEAALKMAFQFHTNRGDEKRTRFLALRHSYHGDTFGAMAVGEPNGFHVQFRKLLAPVDFVEPGNLDSLFQLLKVGGSSYAAFIFEPLVQGAAGMKIYDAEFLQAAAVLCREYGILTIADEVFTGFHRTGSLFAYERAAITPDLVCLSKGITGGFLPLAVTLTSEAFYEAFLSPDIRTAFLHGHSYTANPIACAAAVASWTVLNESSTQRRIQAISHKTSERIEHFKTLTDRVRNARSLGTIGAVELLSDRTYFNSSGSSVFQRAIERGVLLRPLGNVIYSVPPYCCTDKEIDRIYDVMEEIIHEFQ